MRKRKVAVLGATGTVGQRFIGLLQGHPWFELSALTTSDAKAGKRYGDVTSWHWSGEMPAAVAGMKLQPTTADLDAEICFSALPSDAAEQWEAALAKTGHHVFSNVKTHRMDEDVPLLIAEVNAEHMHALDVQRRKRGWSGSIVTNGNCSAIGFALAAAPLQLTFGIELAVVTTMQAISGAGYPGVASLDALDNVVPFIAEEEEKMEQETKKFLGTWDGKRFVDAGFAFSAHCNRVPVRDGHTEAVSLRLRGSPSPELVKEVERRMRVSDQVIKFITVRIDEKLKKIEKRKKARAKRAARRPAPQMAAPSIPTVPAMPAEPAAAAPGLPASTVPAEHPAPAAPAEAKESS